MVKQTIPLVNPLKVNDPQDPEFFETTKVVGVNVSMEVALNCQCPQIHPTTRVHLVKFYLQHYYLRFSLLVHLLAITANEFSSNHLSVFF